MPITQTFTAETYQDILVQAANFLRSEGYIVTHQSGLVGEKLTYAEVLTKYGLKTNALSMRLKRFRDDYPHERGSRRMLWMIITPKLHEHLSKKHGHH